MFSPWRYYKGQSGEKNYFEGNLALSFLNKLSYGDSQKILLRTMENDLGVMFARSQDTGFLNLQKK